jgi:hypothetical protein
LSGKRRLAAIMPRVAGRLLYLDHIAERGRDLFRAACERDLEDRGDVGARHPISAIAVPRLWLKVKNP